jgi:hypothetical protein
VGPHGTFRVMIDGHGARDWITVYPCGFQFPRVPRSKTARFLDHHPKTLREESAGHTVRDEGIPVQIIIPICRGGQPNWLLAHRFLISCCSDQPKTNYSHENWNSHARHHRGFYFCGLLTMAGASPEAICYRRLYPIDGLCALKPPPRIVRAEAEAFP